MTWEEIAALASIASAVILAVGAFAAIAQFRHARMANQLAGYLSLFQQFMGPEMSEARTFVSSLEICDEETAAAQVNAGLDRRIIVVGNYFNELATLVRVGVLDRKLFTTILWHSAALWPKLAPYVGALRRKNQVAIWSDMEYLALLDAGKTPNHLLDEAYPRWFARAVRKQMAAPRTTPPPV